MDSFEKEAEERDVKKESSETACGFPHLFWMYLLFDREPERPDSLKLKEALTAHFGETDKVAEGGLMSFALKRYPVEYQDASVPAQVLIAEAEEFSQDSITPAQRAQLWDVPDSEALLSACTHRLALSDFMAAGLPYKQRGELLTGWLETALKLFPSCCGVWIPSAGKLLRPEQILQSPAEGGDRFIYTAVNARLFNIEGTDDCIVDTLGMYALGLPDVQYHYHAQGVDPNHVVRHAYNVASYIFDSNACIEDGETIDGLDENGNISPGIQWQCQYEAALVEPKRMVMDICPGEFAAGKREQKQPERSCTMAEAFHH